ncbi:MAG: hypothetical protein IH845_05145 [Nanoarchaeota archaeon]|nr:hypothetical protein [Nanoarchaeota archaeon]
MTTKIVNLGWKEAFYIAAAKSIGEQVLTRFIGNGTVNSGGAKLLLAQGVKSMIGGNAGNIISVALTVDGTEDIVRGMFSGQLGSVAGMFGGGGGGSQNTI